MLPSVFTSSVFFRFGYQTPLLLVRFAHYPEIRFANFGIVNERKFEMQPDANFKFYAQKKIRSRSKADDFFHKLPRRAQLKSHAVRLLVLGTCLRKMCYNCSEVIKNEGNTAQRKARKCKA